MNITADFIRALSAYLNDIEIDTYGVDTDGDFYFCSSEGSEEFDCNESDELPF